MTPILVKQAIEPVVPLDDLKDYLRAGDFDDDDNKIMALHNAAVSLLDGYRGILGRCIKSQTWKVSFHSPGKHRLPFPDVQSVEVDAGTATLSHDCLGSIVTLTEAATVTMTVECPPDILASIQQIVRIIVDLWYNDTSLTGPMPPTVNALIAPIRWVRV